MVLEQQLGTLHPDFQAVGIERKKEENESRHTANARSCGEKMCTRWEGNNATW